MKCIAKLLDNAVIGHAFAVLPFGDGFVGYAKHFAQLLLRKVLRVPLLRNKAANGSLIHKGCLLYRRCFEHTAKVEIRTPLGGRIWIEYGMTGGFTAQAAL